MSVSVLASGIDTLHLSARGELRSEVLETLNEAKRRAQQAEAEVPIEFPVTGQAFLMKPFGLRGYSFWLTSPDFELVIGTGERFPAVLVQFHSAYLHSCGPAMGWDLVDMLLAHEMFWGRPDVVVSRIDLYADFQGWVPAVDDLPHFICRGRNQRVFEELFMSGRRLTGFMFGRDSLLARIYDKTQESRKRGTTWLAELWTGGDADSPVWRLEFQFRRQVLSEFHVRTVQEVQASIQDLWAYGTGRWLSLRTPSGEKQVRHWREDPAWTALRSTPLAPSSSGVVRQRIEEATEERVVRGLMGYATSLGAIRDEPDPVVVFDLARPLVMAYLSRRERDFRAEVRRKRSRLMSPTAPIGWAASSDWRVPKVSPS